MWTRNIVCELLASRLGIVLSLASVGALVARLGLTAQKPLQRAYQRHPHALAWSAPPVLRGSRMAARTRRALGSNGVAGAHARFDR